MRHKNKEKRDKRLKRRQLTMKTEGNNKEITPITPTRRPHHMLHMQRVHIFQNEIFNILRIKLLHIPTRKKQRGGE
jgi:hypothetical protein